MDPSHKPLLSVVVVIVSDTTDSRSDASLLDSCLEALSQQVDAPPMEIIVPYHGNVSGIELIKAQYPDVVFIPANDLKIYTGQGGSREHHDELRARGLAAARGEIIGLLEDHARPDLNWCARMVEAHQQCYAAVGGAIENGIDRPLNWAVYFCDFGRYQNPLPAGESAFASDANVSYKRSALESIRSTWQEVFHETAVNWALTSRGEKLALSPEIIVYQNRGSLRLGNALKERFIWGRSYAATRGMLAGASKRAIYATLSPILPLVLLGRMTVNVLKKQRCLGVFLKALPLTAALTLSWSLGELMGYLTGRANPSDASVSRTVTSASNT
jgi:hypothetical protein